MNKTKSIIYGVLIGDALGTTYEFKLYKKNINNKYLNNLIFKYNFYPIIFLISFT